MVNKPGVENVHCSPRGRSALASLRTLAEIVRVWRCRQPTQREGNRVLHSPFQKGNLEKAHNQIRAIYEAFNELLDWLNTVFTVLPKVGRIAMAARARNTSNSAYSTKS